MRKLTLRFRTGVKSEYLNIGDDGPSIIPNSKTVGNRRGQNVDVGGQKRTKERTIGYIIEKVS
jgi:hypothetical protein